MGARWARPADDPTDDGDNGGNAAAATPTAIVIAPRARRLNQTPDDVSLQDRLFLDTNAVHAQRAPASVSLRAHMSAWPVFDQGALGSCTANAIAGAIEYETRTIAEPMTPSRLFIYYNEREMEGTVGEDAGARIRDGLVSVQRVGVCSEDAWPYDVANVDVAPPSACYAETLKVTREYRLFPQTLKEMKRALALGRPVVFGVVVYASFMDDATTRTGDVPMPAAGEEVLGGHAILAVGYDDVAQRVTFRNSWGETWGDGGYGTLAYAFFDDRAANANSMWVVKRVDQDYAPHENDLTL